MFSVFLFFAFLKHIFLKASPGSGAGKDDENYKEEWSRNLRSEYILHVYTFIYILYSNILEGQYSFINSDLPMTLLLLFDGVQQFV